MSWNGPDYTRRGNADSRRLLLAVAAAVLIIVGLMVAWVGQNAAAALSGAPGVAWALSPASNTVLIRLTPGAGPSGRRILARSHLVVSGTGTPRPSPAGRQVRVPVGPGTRARLLVQVAGPRPAQRTLTVAMPPALRVTRFRRAASGLLVSMSGPLRRQPSRALCGQDTVSFPGARVAAVASGPAVCRAVLRVTARDGEQAAVRVTVPALRSIPLYSFANPAHRAIYITVDDGWTPSAKVLAIMRETHLPVVAFLIQDAAEQHLGYWRAFVAAGGTVGDHTVSHPKLTKLSLRQATAQWGQARLGLGRLLGRTPVMGRPPYGAFDGTVEVAAYRGGLKALVGWSATMDSDGLQTWDGRRLEPGEIVLLHWVPGLGQQLARLLRIIHAQHLNPAPLTPADFAGVTPQRRSLDGD
ncbi:MAG TPA: polysaccharide deacetylase family protein [Streptosporangiaceae bacterium]|nr:polysaccharide deacetylase family protein [Streptosporangiaceae bacterium]